MSSERKSISSEKIVGGAAIVIAVLSMIVAVWEGLENREHNRLSVSPLVGFNQSTRNDVSRELDGDGKIVSETSTVQLVLSASNLGLGPAQVMNFQIITQAGGEPAVSHETWQAALVAAGFKGNSPSRTTFFTGDVIEAGGRVTVADFTGTFEENTSLWVELTTQSVYRDVSVSVSRPLMLPTRIIKETQ